MKWNSRTADSGPVLSVGPDTEVKFMQPDMSNWPWLCRYCKRINLSIIECQTCGAPNQYITHPIIVVKNPSW